MPSAWKHLGATVGLLVLTETPEKQEVVLYHEVGELE